MTGKTFAKLFIRKDCASGYVIIFDEEIYHIGPSYRDALLKCTSNRQLFHLLTQKVPESKIKLEVKPLWKSWHNHQCKKTNRRKKHHEQTKKNSR